MKRETTTGNDTNTNLSGPQTTIKQKGLIDPSGMMKTMVQYKNFQFCENPNEELTLSTGALIRKQVDTVSGSEALNKYFIFLQSKNGLRFVFKGESASNNISSRGLKMNIMHIRSKNEEITSICPVYARVNYSGGCLCCKHWKINTEPYQSLIGDIRGISENGCEIYDDRKNELYKIEEFNILKNEQTVGNINKKNMSIGNNTPIAETYQLSFPSGATNESKIILIFATMLIDHKTI